MNISYKMIYDFIKHGGLQAKYSVENYLRKNQLVIISPSKAKILYRFYGIQLYNQVPTKILKNFIHGLRLSLNE